MGGIDGWETGTMRTMPQAHSTHSRRGIVVTELIVDDKKE
jgi:hypothetical protein